jgi:hypothetical protein
VFDADHIRDRVLIERARSDAATALARQLYGSGLAVLDAGRTLHVAELRPSGARQNAADSFIALVKTLRGYWSREGVALFRGDLGLASASRWKATREILRPSHARRWCRILGECRLR